MAQLQLRYFRGLKLATLRWLAGASVPVWLEVHAAFVPGWLGWLAFLVEGWCLPMAAVYAALEYRCARRATQLDPGSSGVVIHTLWTVWDELRSALWYGLALIALVPWGYVGFNRPFPPSLLSALTATAWTVILLLAVAEVLARRRPSHGPDWCAGASGAAAVK